MGRIRFWLWQIFGGMSVREVREKFFDRWIALQFIVAFIVVPAVYKQSCWIAERSGVLSVWDWLAKPRVLSESVRERLLGLSLASFVLVHLDLIERLAARTSSPIFYFTLYLVLLVTAFMFLPFVRAWVASGTSPDETVFPEHAEEQRPIVYCGQLLWFFFREEAWIIFVIFLAVGGVAIIGVSQYFASR